jgi:hypothetical protein
MSETHAGTATGQVLDKKMGMASGQGNDHPEEEVFLGLLG